MICNNCGKQILDNSSVCPFCGAPTAAAPQQPVQPQAAPQQPYAAPQPAQPYAAPQQPAQPYAAPQQPYAAPQQPYAAPQQPQQPFANAGQAFAGAAQNVGAAAQNVTKKVKANPKLFLIAGAAVVVVILLIVIISSIGGGGGYKSAIEGKYKALQKKDAEKLYELAPEFVYGDADKEDIIESLEDEIDEDDEEFGDFKFEIEYKKEERAEDDDLDDIAKALYKRYGDDMDVDKSDFLKSVTDAYMVKYKVTIEGEDDKDHQTRTTLVVKIDGKWYEIGYVDCDFYNDFKK